VEFDATSPRPTYHLRIGVPGASNALDIAARLGMPNDITARARKYLGTDHVEAEAAAQRLDETARELTAQAEQVRKEKQEIQKLRREYEARIARVEAENKRELQRARREAKEVVEKATKEANDTLKELRKAAKKGQGTENKGTEEARKRLRTLQEKVALGDKGAAEHLKQLLEPKATNSPFAETVLTAADFKVGDAALVKSLDKEGEILKIDGEKIEIRVGAMKITVKGADLAKTKKRALVAGVAGIQSRKSWGVPTEINLIGYNVEDALDELEKYLDDALLAGLKSVRIVHGRGSGALRGMVQSFLRTFRAAQSYEFAPQSEGGDGATVVVLG
jgi:DNA mismatch repair protein MutS2